MIRVWLADVLAAHGISAYRSAREVEGVSAKTVYAVKAGRAHPSLAALDRLLTARRKLTGKPIEPGELPEYIPPPEPAWIG